jgi:hypothetical protein
VCLGRSQWPCGLRSGSSAAHRGHGCLSLVSVVCCQVEVSATGWSLVLRSPTECGVSKKCDCEASKKNEAAQAPNGLLSHGGGGNTYSIKGS